MNEFNVIRSKEEKQLTIEAYDSMYSSSRVVTSV